jgi:hypothetical protein
VDVSVWPRCDAEASPERGYYYHPNRHSAGQPIVAGWAYQPVAELSFARDSWVAPVDVRRIGPEEDANDAATEQARELVRRLPERNEPPLFVFDAGYDPVRIQRNLGDCRVQILVRLHSGRTFYADPPTPEHRPVGRPSVHGEKFDLKDPQRGTQIEPLAMAARAPHRPRLDLLRGRVEDPVGVEHDQDPRRAPFQSTLEFHGIVAGVEYEDRHGFRLW